VGNKKELIVSANILLDFTNEVLSLQLSYPSRLVSQSLNN